MFEGELSSVASIDFLLKKKNVKEGFAVVPSQTLAKTLLNRPFQLVHFVFPFQTTWCPHGNFPFVFSLVMRKFARA